MNSTRHRIAAHTKTVKEAGLRGDDMTVALQAVADREDLSANEIRRIAEDANRAAQLELYKVAEDKRFTFKLADGMKVARSCRSKVASAETADSKYAAAAVYGDAFAPPPRSHALGLMQEKISAELEGNLVDSDDRLKLAQLDRARLELEAILKQAEADEISTAANAKKNFAASVQSAADLIMSGITLPSLYEAIIAGAGAEFADHLIELIIDALKARGVKNFQMGFRHRGRPDVLEKLTTQDLIHLCQRASAYQDKTAEYFEASPPTDSKAQKPLRPADAEDILVKRTSGKPIQAYLGDAATNQVRVVNGDHEFVISIKNLVGDQRRIVKSHAAQEFIGCKLKQIAEAMEQLKDVQSASKAQFAKEKAIEDSAKKLSSIGKAFTALANNKVVNALNHPATIVGGIGAGMYAQSREQKALSE